MATLQRKDIKLTGRIGTYSVNIESYGSVREVVEKCKSRTRTSTMFHDMPNWNIHSDWHGVDSYEEALQLLRDGYQPAVEMLKDALKTNKSSTSEQKRISFMNDIQGFAPIVPLALKGVPQSMVNMTMKPIKCKVIDVYYDMVVSSLTTPEEIIDNGKRLLGVIMNLEKRGYKFNLYAVQTYSNTNQGCDMLTIKVKDSSRPLDIKKMSYVLMHPAFFRVIGFDWYSKVPNGVYRENYGHNIAQEVGRSGLNEFVTQVLGKNAVYFAASRLGDENHIEEELTSHENDSKA